jgi:hypothetical protein
MCLDSLKVPRKICESFLNGFLYVSKSIDVLYKTKTWLFLARYIVGENLLFGMPYNMDILVGIVNW